MRLLALLIVLAAALSGADRRPRIAVGGIMHESNSFYPAPTRLADFHIERGPGIAAQYAESASEVAGYFEGAERYGFDVYPTLHASATPGGPVTAEALDALTSELIRMLKAAPPLDGLLLALHGAMVSEKYPHGDAEIARRVRGAMGAGFPIVITHDFHANISPEIVASSTVLLGYKTNPHVDQRERGLKAAEIIARIAKGEIKPVQAIAKPPMLYNILFQNTNVDPLRPIVEETRRLEKDPRILAATVAGGYQYADTPAMGVGTVVVTCNEPALARSEAERLGQMLWATRDRLKLQLPNAAGAVEQALAASRFPVVLVEMGDNIGGGSAGDATFILSELQRQKAQGWVEVIADSQAVKTAARLGIGAEFDQMVGGKTDRLHGEPVRIHGRVKSLHEGKYIETEVRHGGARYHDQGLSAVIEVEGSTRDLPNLLLLTSYRHAPMSLQQLISCGIYPQRQKILVVKAAIAFRAAYEPVAAQIIEVDTPGATAVNPARFTYHRVRRPLAGLAEMLDAGDGEATSYRAEADFPLTADPVSQEWKDVRGVAFEHGRYGEQAPGYVTEVRSRWTDNNLYFLFTCHYEDLNLKPGPPADGETYGLWSWDVAEVFIGSDFENIRSYKEFEVSPRGEWVDLSIELNPGGKNRTDWQWNSGFSNMTRIDEQHKVWYTEMRIPMSSITAWKPEAGRAFRANFYHVQGKPTKFLAWQPVNQDSFHKPEAFGKLVLAK